jgi:hypothetical protein
VSGDAEAVLGRALMARSAPVGVRVATLEGVVEAEWSLTGDGRTLARGLGRDVLLARALVASGVSDHPGRGSVSMLGSLVERAGESTPGPCPADGLAGKIVDAVARYRADLAEHGMVERAEVCARLADSAPPADVIAVDGFVRMPREFESLLVGWAAGGAEVLLSVPWLPDLPGTAATSALVDRLVAAGAVPQMADVSDDAVPPELERVRVELFTGDAPECGTGAVALGVAEGEESEARHIAQVAAQLLERGAPPEGVVIAFADVRRHAEWTRRALADASVPADIEAGVAVGETPFGRALLGLRACTAGTLDLREVAALMRSPFSGARVEEADAADRAWRRAAPGRAVSLGAYGRPVRALLDEASALREAPVGADTASEWKKLADGMLANGYPGAAPLTGEAGRLDAAAHRSFCRALQEATELGEAEVTAAELWDHVVRSRVMPASLRRPGHVLVTSVDRVSAHGCDHVILGGLTAAEFPRRGSEDRLEGDSIELAMACLGVVADPGEHAREERRAFYLAVSSARRSITLVRRGASDEGVPLRESVFWDEFLDLYRRPGDPLPAGALPKITPVPSSGARLQGGRRPRRGEVRAPATLEGLASTSEVSPSEVEAYLGCPYRWFVERRLRAQAPDRTVDVAAAGRMAHDALARFYREWASRGERRVTEETRDEAVRLAEATARDVVSAAGSPGTLEELTLLEGIVPEVASLVSRDARFLPDHAPEHVEWAFGRASEAPAVELGGVLLVGRADRIDIGPQGLVIVDYKRTHASSLAQIRREGLVQLQLYAAAASRALGLPIAGGVYRSLKDGSDRGFVLEGVAGAFNRNDVIGQEGLDGLLDEAVASAVDVAERMRAGHITPTPSAQACRYCSAAAFCEAAVTA